MKIKTFGCKVNTYDSGLLAKRLDENQSVQVINSCAVTAEATKEAMRYAKKLKKEDPKQVVVVTGCAAQVDTEKFADLAEVDLVIANSHKTEISEIINDFLTKKNSDKVFKSNIFKKEELEVGGGEESCHTRSFLKIQDGCNSFCTFCVIPFARGKSRSIPVDSLIEKINELYKKGVREVVLTGVHIGDYVLDGRPLKPKDYQQGQILPAFLKELLAKTKMPRFRLSSLEPIELSEELFEVFKDERICKHFHMSIQSGNSKILKDMKRKYGQAEVKWSLEEINRRFPEAFVGMDVIAGFPGESEEEFADTYELLNQTPWTRLHVFPYSPRPGTVADKMSEALDRSTIKARARRLRELSEQRWLEQSQKQVGSQKMALVLNKGALSRDYWPIALPEKVHNALLPGSEILVSITKEANERGQLPAHLVR